MPKQKDPEHKQEHAYVNGGSKRVYRIFVCDVSRCCYPFAFRLPEGMMVFHFIVAFFYKFSNAFLIFSSYMQEGKKTGEKRKL